LSHWELAVLALALAVDAFSVAAAVAPGCSARWGAIRLAGAFGFFQALMPLLGALAGTYALAYVHRYDH
jgi:putative Mn2+ efflux pump MntP